MSVERVEISRRTLLKKAVELCGKAALVAAVPGGAILSPLGRAAWADSNSASTGNETMTVAQAGSDATCAPVLGFAEIDNLSIQDGMVLKCVSNETHNPNGDAVEQFIDVAHNDQLVTDAWRKADNWTAETNGYYSWVNGPNGLQKRLNTERFPWEANPDNLPLAQPIPLQNPISSQDAINMLQNYEAAHQTLQPIDTSILSEFRMDYAPGVIIDRSRVPDSVMSDRISELEKVGDYGKWAQPMINDPNGGTNSQGIYLGSRLVNNGTALVVDMSDNFNVTYRNMADHPNNIHHITLTPNASHSVDFEVIKVNYLQPVYVSFNTDKLLRALQATVRINDPIEYNHVPSGGLPLSGATDGFVLTRPRN